MYLRLFWCTYTVVLLQKFLWEMATTIACSWLLCYWLEGRKINLFAFFYSAPSSIFSVKRDCWGIKAYACVSGSSQLISLKYSRLGCCSICWGGGCAATRALSRNTANRFQQSASTAAVFRLFILLSGHFFHELLEGMLYVLRLGGF